MKTSSILVNPSLTPDPRANIVKDRANKIFIGAIASMTGCLVTLGLHVNELLPEEITYPTMTVLSIASLGLTITTGFQILIARTIEEEEELSYEALSSDNIV